MRAGQLNRRIQITRTVTAPNPDEPWVPGEPTTTVIASLRAAQVQQSAEEFMRNFGESQETAVVFRIRFRADIALTDHLVFDGRAYDLVETKEIGHRDGLELRVKNSSSMSVEQVAEGTVFKINGEITWRSWEPAP